jgi:hypothetical protein
MRDRWIERGERDRERERERERERDREIERERDREDRETDRLKKIDELIFKRETKVERNSRQTGTSKHPTDRVVHERVGLAHVNKLVDTPLNIHTLKSFVVLQRLAPAPRVEVETRQWACVGVCKCVGVCVCLSV